MTEENGKPKRKIGVSDVVIIGGIVVAVIYGIWYFFLGPKVDIRVNDVQISMRNTVQELIDEGFVLCDVGGETVGAGMNVRAKEIYTRHYYLGVPLYGKNATNTGLELTLANFGSADKELSQCSIYEIAYHPQFQKGATVLIGGENLQGADLDEWIAFFEKQGYPFKKEELEKFRTGNKMRVSGKRGNYQFAGALDYHSKQGPDRTLVYEYTFQSITFTRDIDVEYKKK